MPRKLQQPNRRLVRKEVSFCHIRDRKFCSLEFSFSEHAGVSQEQACHLHVVCEWMGAVLMESVVGIPEVGSGWLPPKRGFSPGC